MVLLVVVAVCFGLLTAQARGDGAARTADLATFLVTPFQIVLARAHRASMSVWEAYQDWKYARAENRQLRAENERLKVEALRTLEAIGENRRLRRLLELAESLPMTAVAGEVIGREGTGWVRSLTVDRGIGQGIGAQTPVIVPEGLVGRVVRVRPGAAVIQLLTDPASSVGAVVQRTRTLGLVEGDPRGNLRFKFMARDGAGITGGDVIVTSGQGTIFPRGIPVGRVIRIEDKGSALFHFAVLAPVVDFARIEEVLLVTGRTTEDLARVFAPSNG